MGVFWLCVLALIIIIYRHITRNFSYWKDRDVPYPPPIPIFGNTYDVMILKQSLGEFVHDLYNYTESKLVGFFIFDQPFLLIRDLDIIKSILIKDFEIFDRRTIAINERDDKFGSIILSNLRNPEWREIRGKLTPTFSTGKIKGTLDLILQVTNDMEDFIKQELLVTGGTIDCKELSLKYTTDIISSCAFGINSNSFKFMNADFIVAARRIFHFTVSRSIQWASYIFAPCLVKLFGMKFLDPTSVKFLREVFWEQMHQREASKTKRGDLLDNLLQIKAENKEIDEDIVVAQALQFFIAGFETTGNTISFTLYELAANVEIQRRLRAEIKKTLEVHGKTSYEAIMDMRYLDSVLNETLRIYPPLTFIDRRCQKTYTIPDTNVTIKEGIPVYISLLGLHMDPAYFSEPEKFNPDRFSDENKGSIKPFTYMPFGEGPRNCIGARFGSVTAKAAIIAIVSNFELELDPRTPYPMIFDPKSGFLMSPKGGVIYLRYKLCTQEIE